MAMVRALLRQHLLDAKVWAYGSRVPGKGHEASDLDLVVRNPENPRVEMPGVAKLKAVFAESDLPILVDVVEGDAVGQTVAEQLSIGAVFRIEMRGCHGMLRSWSGMVNLAAILASCGMGRKIGSSTAARGPLRHGLGALEEKRP
ncbi:MAG: nucleotidyltransferase domain-containing protein [Magnetococcales bacterium]|nr:nucleotidyltransferase domain-containing protein [Magnetococcales bacterium]